jgi:SNF family Na+-dependent transporter
MPGWSARTAGHSLGKLTFFQQRTWASCTTNDLLDAMTGIVLLPLGVLTTAIVLGWLAPASLMEREVNPEFVSQACLRRVRFARGPFFPCL